MTDLDMTAFGADVDPTEEVITLQPGDDFDSARTRLTVMAGEVNTFEFEGEDGNSYTGYITADGFRLQRYQVRPQLVPSTGLWGLSARMSVIADNEEIGVIVDGERHPHPLYNHERPLYRHAPSGPDDPAEGVDYVWSNTERKPHRIMFNQWMRAEDGPLARSLALAMRETANFQVIFRDPKRSRPRRGRTTVDIIEARPNTRGVPAEERRAHDLQLAGFEVAINPNYEFGFRNFYAGLNDLIREYNAAMSHGDPSVRSGALVDLDRVIGHLSGLYRDEANNVWRPRPVDVGVLMFGDPVTEHMLFATGADDPDRLDSVFKNILAENEERAAAREAEQNGGDEQSGNGAAASVPAPTIDTSPAKVS